MTQHTTNFTYKVVHIRERNPETNTHMMAFYSFYEQMLMDKFEKYNRSFQNDGNFEVVDETEKAVKIKVEGVYKKLGSDFEDEQPWEVWMPKVATVEFSGEAYC